jgi:hypothetical protein
MALFYECTPQCARKLLDSADIVGEAIFQQLTTSHATSTRTPRWQILLSNALHRACRLVLVVFIENVTNKHSLAIVLGGEEEDLVLAA